MSLRINTNISSVNSLRNLQVTDRALGKSLERLSSGLRINRGADDPSALVISERLRQQISALKQNSENSQNALNVVSTADNALGKISDLLTEIQDSIEFALSTGSASPEQIAAEQDSVDQAIDAIDRIATTTRYGDRALLNGSASYKMSTSPTLADSASGGSYQALQNMKFRSVNFVGSSVDRDFKISLGQDPQRAELFLTDAQASAADGSGSTVLRVTGALGSADITVAFGSTGSSIARAINTVSEKTGVFAHSDDFDVVVKSAAFGGDQFVSVQAMQNQLTLSDAEVRNDAGALSAAGITDFAAGTSNAILTDRGVDAMAAFDGVTYKAKGLAFNINGANASFSFELNADMYHVYSYEGVPGELASASAQGSGITFKVSRTGLDFQIRERASITDRLSLGINGATAEALGFDRLRDVLQEAQVNGGLSGGSVASGAVYIGGFLNSLRTGQGNDLTQNAANALRIVSAASMQVAQQRGFLGAIASFSLDSNIESIDVASENLQASLSSLRDLDFAEETANFARTQILFQSGIASLASARVIPQAVLQLLG